MWRQWRCETCKVKFDWAKEVPTQILKACVFYGNYGRPPFNRIGYNNSPLIANFVYCLRCSGVKDATTNP